MRTAFVAGAAVTAVGLLAFLVLRDSGDAGRSNPADRPERACTLIACGPGVRVVVAAIPADARSARVCVEGSCGVRQRLDRPGPLTATLPPSARRGGERVRIAVRLLDRNGRTVGQVSRRATVRATRPNGPDCPPTCFQARIRIDATLTA